ncbi:hypothetical protein M9H77_23834 [Catharanthus roseus]|uniref:Uncharacterized protein n=1 Tax=Catharanthus roseus TaxID=4058 RepID=A0ACC0AUU6_CATRO|nr:hypothetical protein M9H77_23834 [Catharanthus roseus]
MWRLVELGCPREIEGSIAPWGSNIETTHLQNGRLHVYRDLREKGLGMFPSHFFSPKLSTINLNPKFKPQIEAPNLRHIPIIYQALETSLAQFDPCDFLVVLPWLLSQLLDVLACLTGSHQDQGESRSFLIYKDSQSSIISPFNS